MANGNKTDMERVALFKEMGYVSIGDPYKVTKLAFNESATKGKQLLGPSTKTKNATQVGYFSDKFGRIMEGESYTDPVRMRRQWRLNENKKIIAPRNWVPSSGEKKPSGLGNYYGTISGKIEYFAAIAKEQKAGIESKRNFTTNPSKKGTGYGYIGVGLGKYPDHANEEYSAENKAIQKDAAEGKRLMKGTAFRLGMHPRSLFEENPFRLNKALPPAKQQPKSAPPRSGPFRPSHPGKILGGNKAGCFEKWPSHSEDKYTSTSWQGRPVKVVNNSGKTYVPTPYPRTAPQRSIVNQNVDRAVNVNNYKLIKAVTASCGAN